MGRTAVCCPVPFQDTLLPSKKSQGRHWYRDAPSTAVLVWVSPAIAYFRTWLYWTWTDLWAPGGSFHLPGPCKKKLLFLDYLFFNCDLSYLWFTCAHTAHVLNTGDAAKQASAHFNWKWPVDGVLLLFLSPLPSVTRPTSPLPCLVWSGLSLNFPLPPTLSFGDKISSFWSCFLPCLFSLKLFYSLLYNYFNLDYATSFFTCTYLCVFSMHVILLKYVLKLARNYHQHFTQNMARS